MFYVPCSMNKRGFTIVEILISLGIFSTILLSVISFVLWMNYYSAKTKADRETAENARRMMDIMTYEIKNAKSIYTPTTAFSQLSLETSKYLPEDEIAAFIDFFLCGSDLCLKKESQDPIVLNSGSVEVSSLSFSQILNGNRTSIQINLTVNYKNQNNASGNYASVSLTSTASPRSY